MNAAKQEAPTTTTG
jgi:hypothetical protein